MELSTLRIFAAVADEAGVTPAAARLHLVPSAVTTRIRKLEEEIGQPLFLRERRGMTLTARGRILRDYAERILALAADAARAVSGEDDTPRGELRVGVTDTAATVYLPPVFAAFHERYPMVSLSIESNVTEVLVAAVKDRRLDCAMVARSVAGDAFRCRLIRRERLVLVSAWSVADVFALDEFTYLSARAGGVQRARVEEWWAQSDNPPLRIVELPTIALRLTCAAAGMGVAVIPETALSRLANRETVRSHALPEPWCWQDSFLLWRAELDDLPARRAFADILLDAFSDKDVDESVAK